MSERMNFNDTSGIVVAEFSLNNNFKLETFSPHSTSSTFNFNDTYDDESQWLRK